MTTHEKLKKWLKIILIDDCSVQLKRCSCTHGALFSVLPYVSVVFLIKQNVPGISKRQHIPNITFAFNGT